MSAVMSSTTRGWLAIAAFAVVGAAAQLSPATGFADPNADPNVGPQTEVQPSGDQLLHNVTYRARADGTSRGAVVAYKIDDSNVNSEQPTLLPGSTFEVNTVLANPKQAGMELSIQWPYGSNLHCEILVDDQIVAQADQFIAPRLLHPKNDPLYGVIQCGAPLDTPIAGETPATVNPAAAPPAAQVPSPAT
jgi:Rieske Fe-S protein